MWPIVGFLILVVVGLVLYIFRDRIFVETTPPGETTPTPSMTPTPRGTDFAPPRNVNTSGTFSPDQLRSLYPSLFADQGYRYAVKFDPCPSNLTNTYTVSGKVHCQEIATGNEVSDDLCFGHNKPLGESRFCFPTDTADDGTGYAWQITDWGPCKRSSSYTDINCKQSRTLRCTNSEGEENATMCTNLPPDEYILNKVRDCTCPPICRMGITAPECPVEFPCGQYPNDDGTYPCPSTPAPA